MVNSIQFPKMFTRTKTHLVQDYDATKQNLSMLLNSEQGELFGDPEFGTKLKCYLQDPNDNILADIIIDSIYTAIATFIPQVRIYRSDIEIVQSMGKLSVNIPCTNMETFQTDMYNIVLLQREV